MSEPTSRPPVTGGVVIGWREHVGLPDLGITVQAKIDTGARTSALHASNITPSQDGAHVSFTIHHHHDDVDETVETTLPVHDVRDVKSSSGEVQRRYVVHTTAKLHRRRWTIELTLAAREEMGFRMLLGRQAVRGRFLVDPAASYLAGGG